MKRKNRYNLHYPSEGISGKKAIIFFALLSIISIISLIIPLRPTYSAYEKRDLTKFPTFSIQSLSDGSYFRTIDLWFSDTFPFRDSLITFNSYVKSMYGLNPVQVSGNLEHGDEIPSAPLSLSSSEPESVSEAELTSSLPEESAIPSSKLESSEEAAPEKDMADAVTQNLGAVLIVDDAGYEYYNFSKSVADQYSSMLNRSVSRLKGVSEVYSMLIPTSMDIILPDSFRSGLNTSSQKDAIEYITGSLDPAIHPVKIYDTLKAHSDEYIYFRTDHHWTALGAYYAYKNYASVKNFSPLALSEFTTKEYDNFMGAFYSDTKKNPALAKNPDTVIAYLPPANATLTLTNKDGKSAEWPIISNVSDWASSSKYSAFIGGDNPYTVIENSGLSDGSSCIVVKESFGNAFVPFLVSHYQTVHVIDYRYWKGNLVDFAKKKSVDDVLFLNNISATRNSSLVEKMSALIK